MALITQDDRSLWPDLCESGWGLGPGVVQHRHGQSVLELQEEVTLHVGDKDAVLFALRLSSLQEATHKTETKHNITFSYQCKMSSSYKTNIVDNIAVIWSIQ